MLTLVAGNWWFTAQLSFPFSSKLKTSRSLRNPPPVYKADHPFRRVYFRKQHSATDQEKCRARFQCFTRPAWQWFHPKNFANLRNGVTLGILAVSYIFVSCALDISVSVATIHLHVRAPSLLFSNPKKLLDNFSWCHTVYKRGCPIFMMVGFISSGFIDLATFNSSRILIVFSLVSWTSGTRVFRVVLLIYIFWFTFILQTFLK